MSNQLTTDITPGMIDQLSAPPEFKAWARGWLIDERKRLFTVLAALVKSGAVASETEGLTYLAKLCKQSGVFADGVAARDFSAINSLHAFAVLEQYVTAREGENFSQSTVIRQIGALSHWVIGSYLSGRVPDFSFAQRAQLQAVGDCGINFLPFSEQTEAAAVTCPQKLFSAAELSPAFNYLREILIGNRISEKLRAEIAQLHLEIMQRFGSGKVDNNSAWQAFDRQLFVRLWPIFGPQLDRLVGFSAPGEGEFGLLVFLALCTWAGFLPEVNAVGGDPKTLFLEIPVLDFHLGLGQTRIDALEVVAVNGVDPKNSQLTILRQFAQAVNSRQCSIRSVAHLVKELERYLGTSAFTLRIIDWKFAVGDAVEPGAIFGPELAYYPPSKHITQIRQYLTLAALGNAFLRGTKLEEIWLEQALFASKGQLAYYFPFALPRKVRIQMDEYAKLELFGELANKFPSATRKAQIRKLGNFVLGEVLRVVEGRPAKRQATAIKPASSSVHTLFSCEPYNHQTLKAVIEQHYQYLDARQIVRVVGKSQGRERYTIRLDCLLQAINAGQLVVSPGFTFPDGRVVCPHPAHQDKNPSLYLYPHGGKCFACGFYAPYDPDSVPVDLQALVLNARVARRQIGRVGQIVVSDEIDRIMRAAQEAFVCGLEKSSQAARYLLGRKIDLDLARSLGVGYATFDSINLLLDGKWSYDQLIQYGFVSIRAIRREKSSAWLFEKRRMLLEQITRPLPAKGKATEASRPLFGWPVLPLLDRLTFPLVLADRYTNFYGRLAGEPEEGSRISKHWKLKFSGCVHGGFNLNAAMHNRRQKVVVTEGVFDLLALIQAGAVAVDEITAVVGIDNRAIFDYLARAEGNLALALDFDEAGRQATDRKIKQLKESGFRGAVSDFTADFLERHPEAGQFDDFSSWWQKCGSLSRLKE